MKEKPISKYTLLVYLTTDPLALITTSTFKTSCSIPLIEITRERRLLLLRNNPINPVGKIPKNSLYECTFDNMALHILSAELTKTHKNDFAHWEGLTHNIRTNKVNHYFFLKP